MKVRDVMSSPAVTVQTSTGIVEAATLLVGAGFTALPVVDEDGALVGILTEADLIRNRIPVDPRIHGHVWDVDRPPVQLTVQSLMSTPVESLTPGADAADAARIMVEERIRCLPVVDGRVVGVITRRDLVRAGVIRTDADIVAAVEKSLASLTPADRWTVSVQAGVAEIEDHLADPSRRELARTMAEEVPGVVFASVSYQVADPS